MVDEPVHRLYVRRVEPVALRAAELRVSHESAHHGTGEPGSHPYRLPLIQTAADTAAGFNRSEYARQLPPDTRGYARAYGRRPPAESDNSRRELRYVFHRLPAYGDEQPSLVVLLGSLLDNSKADGSTAATATPKTRPPDTAPPARRTAQARPQHPEARPRAPRGPGFLPPMVSRPPPHRA